ncbi:uncharacterized protein LOC115085247 [Rhinatrema bivittatum]|uniref:uncharacterized protein LOC115085247 n=1 Tax=Rhinatrema bivittatum TaxID=194408 RepID=UPI001129F382|nr:uncharacterized protein LOC115085247 [Rhinatrema bivittatum]
MANMSTNNQLVDVLDFNANIAMNLSLSMQELFPGICCGIDETVGLLQALPFLQADIREVFEISINGAWQPRKWRPCFWRRKTHSKRQRAVHAEDGLRVTEPQLQGHGACGVKMAEMSCQTGEESDVPEQRKNRGESKLELGKLNCQVEQGTEVAQEQPQTVERGLNVLEKLPSQDENGSDLPKRRKAERRLNAHKKLEVDKGQQRQAEGQQRQAEGAPEVAEGAPEADERQQRQAEEAPEADERQQRQAEEAPEADEGQQRQAEGAPEADEGQQRQAEGAPEADEGQQRQAEGAPEVAEEAPEAAERQQRQAEGAPEADEGQQRQAEGAPEVAEEAPEAAERQQRQAEGAPEADEGQQRQAEGAPEVAEEAPEADEGQQRQAEGAPEAAERQQRQAEGAPEAAEGQQRQAEGAPEADEGQQRQAEGAPEADEGQQRQAEGAPEADEGQQRQAEEAPEVDEGQQCLTEAKPEVNKWQQTPEQTNVLEDQQHQNKGKKSIDQARKPNYFVAIPITNDQILDKIEDVQELIVTKEAKLLRALIPVVTAHLTIIVAHLPTTEEVEKAVSALLQCKSKVEAILQGELLNMTFHGIGQFNGQVIYVKMGESEQKVLSKIAEFVASYFHEMGIDITGSKVFKPHLTFLKLSKAPSLRRKGFRKICSDLYKEYEDSAFGTETFGRIDLCSMHKKKQESGYYHCECSIQVGPSSTGVAQEPKKKESAVVVKDTSQNGVAEVSEKSRPENLDCGYTTCTSSGDDRLDTETEDSIANEEETHEKTMLPDARSTTTCSADSETCSKSVPALFPVHQNELMDVIEGPERGKAEEMEMACDELVSTTNGERESSPQLEGYVTADGDTGQIDTGKLPKTPLDLENGTQHEQ